MTQGDVQLMIDNVIRSRYLADGICRFIQETMLQLESVTRERDALKKRLDEIAATIKPCSP